MTLCIGPVTRLAALVTLAAVGCPEALRTAHGASQAGAPRGEPAGPPNAAVSGTVSVARGGTMVPQAGVWVALHRVARDSAGVIDSARTATSGAFHIRYRRATDSEAVYFVSTMYAGIAYFSSALDVDPRSASAREPVELTVYDTTNAPVPIDIASRHIIVSAPDWRAGRDVTEVYVIVNGGERTRVAEPGGATFDIGIPKRARDVRIGEGDVAPDAVTITAGRLSVNSPIAPGTKRFSVSYRLGLAGGALELARDRPAAFVEVLVADSVASVTGAAMQEQAPVALTGGTYRRFIASNVDAGGPLRVGVRDESGFGVTTPVAFVTVAALAMGIALLVALRRKARPGAAAGAAASAAAALAPDALAE